MFSEDLELGKKVVIVLQQVDVGNLVNLKWVEYVGLQVGEELCDQGGFGMFLVLGGILLYVGFCFQWKFVFGVIFLLVYDVIIVMGVLLFFQVIFDLIVFVVVLVVVGYLLNDIIVIFDWVCENFCVLCKVDLVENLNIFISQILLCIIVILVFMLLVIVVLLFFGGDNLFGFFIVLFVGVMVGIYLLIYIVNVVLIWLNLISEDLILLQVKDIVDDCF